MSLSQRILKIDSRWLWLVLLIGFAIPAVHPLALPLRIGPDARLLYNTINNLPAGSVVAVDVSLPLQYWTELGPATEAVSVHLFSRPVKILFWTLEPQGPVVIQQILDDLKPDIEGYGKKYGQDYVNLGYISGQETAMAALMTNTQKVVANDYYGNHIDSLPLMNNVKSSKDIGLLISVLIVTADERVRQYSVLGGLSWAAIETIAWVPGFRPYVASKQVLLVLGGARGGAEYELISKHLGKGTASVDMLSVTLLMTAALVILGNIAYLTSLRRGKQ